MPLAFLADSQGLSFSAELWSSVGAFLSGPFAQALASRPSPSSSWPFFSDDAIPGAVDFHAIAWLARTVTAAGGSIEKLEEAIGGQKVDASVRDYYEAWKARESFKKLGIVRRSSDPEHLIVPLISTHYCSHHSFEVYHRGSLLVPSPLFLPRTNVVGLACLPV